MEEIPQASSDFNKEWMFPEREIIISDTILGKGAFGEVRVAKWRNINVAAKRLHGLIIEQENELYDQQLQSHNLEILNLFREEMLTLSKLRHPNLVLFLGIGYSSNYRQPTTILTELLSYSLYDLLETHKIQLTLPEIIDISLDIACGLDYLHSNNPSIIHRDISSKNILIGGNHAKIADLGQAKIFGSTALSRQTAMPGAMAYSAPEVLTGKYTTKIDIFSYGILLIQMCCNEYPRLDRRDEQYKAAISKFDPLHTLITETIEYQPNNRPTASKICEILKEIRNNDRYYPPTRRIPPQCDISIHARRWLEETVEERCGDIRIALEQTSRRVHIEEQRWRDEAERVDKIYQELNHLRQQVGVYDQTLTNKNHEIAQLNREIHQLKRENEQKSLEIQSLLTEKDHLNQLNQDLTHRLHDMEVLLSVQKHEKKAFEIDLEEMKSQLLQARQHENTAKSSESQVKYQLTLQMDHCQELETRLEQILSRWKHEKEQVKLETIRCTKLRETCAELVEKDQRRKEEIDRLTSRLNMYNTLPLPDEIKARFADNEKDIERLSELTETLRLEKQQMGQRLVALQDENEKFQQELAEEKQNYLQITKQMAVKDERIRHLEVMVNELDEEMQRKMKEISGLEQDKKNLKEITENIREQLSAAKDEVHAANAARRRAELDAQKRGEGSDRGKRYGRVSSQKRAAKAPVLEEEGEESYSDDSDEEEEKGGRQKQRQGGERKNSDGEEEEDDEDEENESRDIFNIDSPSSPSNQRPLSSSANGLDEIFDPDTRTRILHDQEKLRRYSIATRLKKVKSGELGTAELNAIKENTATRFHSYGSGNFTDLVKSASSTHDHLLKLQESRQIGDQEDPYERQREQDMHAKARILSAGERGGAKKIIECIWEHLDCEHTIWRGARALREAFVKEETIKQECIENKCEEVLIAGLTAYPSSILVQTQCLRTLGALVFGSDLVRRHSGEKGALRRIVIALQLHSHDEQVVLQACTALTNLCHNSHDNRGRYLEVQGTEPLLAAMAIHLETSVKVQRQACWALLTLAGSDEIARVIVGQGGDNHIMKAMIQWKHDAGLQQFACWAICNLALADDENKQKMRQSGLLEMCHIALETHENNLEVVRQARHTIAVLGSLTAGNEESRPKSKRKPTILKPVGARVLSAGGGTKKGSRK